MSECRAFAGVHTDGSLVLWGPQVCLDKYLSAIPQGTFLQVVTNGETACAPRDDYAVLCWGDDELGYVSHAPTSL